MFRDGKKTGKSLKLLGTVCFILGLVLGVILLLAGLLHADDMDTSLIIAGGSLIFAGIILGCLLGAIGCITFDTAVIKIRVLQGGLGNDIPDGIEIKDPDAIDEEDIPEL